MTVFKLIRTTKKKSDVQFFFWGLFSENQKINHSTQTIQQQHASRY